VRIEGVRRLLCIVVLALGAAAVPAEAAVRPADAAATHRYLLARVALRRAQAQQASGSLAVWQGLAARLQGECPGILAGTPLAGPKPATDVPGEYADGKLEFELGFAVLLAPEALHRAGDAQFYDVVRRLRWSNRALTRLLRRLALQSLRQAELPTPDLCGDLRYWTAGGYVRISPATERYDLAVEGILAMASIDLQPGEPEGLDFEGRVAYRLGKYEAPADRRLARRAFAVGRELTDPAGKPVLEAIEKVYTALGRKTA
jgi:hypothetical protein